MTYMPHSERLHFGLKLEQKAEAYLLEQGTRRLIARNFRTRRGELDLVFEELACERGGTELVAVEVRARLSGSWLSGLESIEPRKELRLKRAMAAFLSIYRGQARSFRLDLMAWDGANWTHFKNISPN